MAEISEIWGFVEKYYPNYSSSDEIAENGDLHKLLEESYEEGDCAHDLYKELRDELEIHYGGDDELIESALKTQIENLYNASAVKIYEAAIEGYIESLKTV